MFPRTEKKNWGESISWRKEKKVFVSTIFQCQTWQHCTEFLRMLVVTIKLWTRSSSSYFEMKDQNQNLHKITDTAMSRMSSFSSSLIVFFLILPIIFRTNVWSLLIFMFCVNIDVFYTGMTASKSVSLSLLPTHSPTLATNSLFLPPTHTYTHMHARMHAHMCTHLHTHSVTDEERHQMQSNEANYTHLNSGIRLRSPYIPSVNICHIVVRSKSCWECTTMWW